MARVDPSYHGRDARKNLPINYLAENKDAIIFYAEIDSELRIFYCVRARGVDVIKGALFTDRKVTLITA